ncbi:hypothetical protein GCM10027080_29100 [Pedococcus soli]
MNQPPPILTPSLALAMVVEASRVLSGASFDGVTEAAPVLLLEALPCASRVELALKRPGDSEVLTRVATREGHGGLTSVATGTKVVSFDISLWGHPAAGTVSVSVHGDDDDLWIASITAELLTIQVESALDRALDHEPFAAPPPSTHQAALDIGTATGLLMVREGLSRDSALERLRELSRQTDRALADIATNVIDERGAVTHHALLALVRPTGVVERER